MIAKHKDYKYKVGSISKGGKGDKQWTRFSVGDYNKKKRNTAYLVVMCWFDMALEDGDHVTFNDYQVGANKYNGITTATIFVVNPEDIFVAEFSNDVATQDVAELPWL